MIIIHDSLVYFETNFDYPLCYTVNLTDLIHEDKFILPLNGLYYNFFENKEITILNKSNNIRLDKDAHILYLLFTKDKEIYLVLKDKEDVVKVKLPNKLSIMIDDNTKAGENIFNYNLKEYKEKNYTIKDILQDIYSKTCFQNKSQFAYLSTIDALFFQDLSLIHPYVPKQIEIKKHTISDLAFISDM